MAKYRKRPVVIEAVQFLNTNEQVLPEWMRPHVTIIWDLKRESPVPQELLIDTLEGAMRAMPGDYVIKGVKGEVYPVKNDIFEATYEPVEE